MSITFVGGDANDTSTSPITATIPAGASPGDIVLFFLSVFNTGDITWTATTSGTTTPTLLESDSPGSVDTVSLWQMTVADGDPGATLTISSSDDTYLAVALACYSGAQEISSGDWLYGYQDASGSWAAPEVTSGADDCWGVYFAFNQNGNSEPSYASGVSRETSSDEIAVWDSDGSVGNAGTTVGGGDWTGAGSAWTGFTIALAPAGTADIQVVQQESSAPYTSAPTVTLPDNVTDGNSVIIGISVYSSSGTMSVSDFTYGGTEVDSATILVQAQSAQGATFSNYNAIVLLPALAGGSADFAATVANGDCDGFWAVEVSGLGASPVSGPVSSGDGIGGSLSSGAITIAQEAIVIGIAGTDNELFGDPPASSPWTSYQIASGYVAAGYQVASSGSASWAPAATLGDADDWSAVIAAIVPASSPSPSGTGLPPAGDYDRPSSLVRKRFLW